MTPYKSSNGPERVPTCSTPSRDQLVNEWRELWARIEVSHGAERGALLRELHKLEAEAMRLIVAEQQDGTHADSAAAVDSGKGR